MITQPLAELAPAFVPESTPAIIHEVETHLTNRSVLWGFIIMFVGVATGVIGRILLHVDVVTVVGVLISLAGMFLVTYPFLLPQRRPKNDSGPSLQPEVLTRAEPTMRLPQASDIEYVTSVTERTTDLLKDPAANSIKSG